MILRIGIMIIFGLLLGYLCRRFFTNNDDNSNEISWIEIGFLSILVLIFVIYDSYSQSHSMGITNYLILFLAGMVVVKCIYMFKRK